MTIHQRKILNWCPIMYDQGKNKTPLFVKNIKEGLEDTKGVIRICESKKDKQHNDQTEKDKMTNNDLQSITHKTED